MEVGEIPQGLLEQANEYVEKLKSDKRYKRDVY